MGSLLKNLLEFAEISESGAKFKFGESIDLSKGPKTKKRPGHNEIKSF